MIQKHHLMLNIPDESLSLLVSDDDHLSLVVWFLNFLIQLFVQKFELWFVVDKNNLVKELRGRTVDNRVHSSQKCAPTLIVKHLSTDLHVLFSWKIRKLIKIVNNIRISCASVRIAALCTCATQIKLRFLGVNVIKCGRHFVSLIYLPKWRKP